MSFVSKFFRGFEKRALLRYQKRVPSILEKSQAYEKLPNEELKKIANDLKEKGKSGVPLDDLVPEAFALVREAAWRTIGQRHYPVQLLGGMVLHEGNIAEMTTGEGKTLVATIPAVLNALPGKGVHVITVNDYLARRDAEWMGPVYHFLGLSVGVLNHETAYLYDPKEQRTTDIGSGEFLRSVSRKEAYEADITYGTNNEYGFDYLRDNMVMDPKQKVQRENFYAIVDEIDSILIDEARTPLIISSPAAEATDMYYRFSRMVSQLEENGDYNVDEKMHAATLTDAGISKMEKWLGYSNVYAEGGIEVIHHIEQALKARTLFRKDKDYVIKDEEIIIVDEFTGRLMFGRRYSEGLHQAIEAKENVQIKQESRTLATITFQNYFRMYKKLAGMTGTASTESEEFHKIYNLDVIAVPTNRPMIRVSHPDKIFKTEQAKYQSVVEKIKELHAKGQPVLLGTISIEKNEFLDQALEREGIPHILLNAKNHEKEAHIIAKAGEKGAVTVATNMAGRGVDIKLGEGVKELGGLYVLGTERHEARRIDNQLRGRSGRQGDPGTSQFFISLEDDLLRVFGGPRLKGIMERLQWPEEVPIENRIISRQIEAAQKKVEGHNFDTRKHLVEYDDVMNLHREIVYRRRNQILTMEKGELRDYAFSLIEKEIQGVVSFHANLQNEKEWNVKEIGEVIRTIFPFEGDLQRFKPSQDGKLGEAHARTEIIAFLVEQGRKAFENWQKSIGDLDIVYQVLKSLILRSIDTLWVEHLDQMSYLREGIGLRGYGQRDPLVEYKREAYTIFTGLVANIEKEIVYSVFKIVPVKQEQKSLFERSKHILTAPKKEGDQGQAQSQEPIKADKVGRNDPCSCGSGKKYKKCHGA